MTKKNAEKTKARALQEELALAAQVTGREPPNYQKCLELIREHGYEEAKRRLMTT